MGGQGGGSAAMGGRTPLQAENFDMANSPMSYQGAPMAGLPAGGMLIIRHRCLARSCIAGRNACSAPDRALPCSGCCGHIPYGCWLTVLSAD